jgi:hypothetical protein
MILKEASIINCIFSNASGVRDETGQDGMILKEAFNINCIFSNASGVPRDDFEGSL